MPVVQWHHAVQTLAPQGSNDPFTDRIRHRHPHRRFEHTQSHMPDASIQLVGKNSIPIMDQAPVAVIDWNRLSELL
jgi:hypothetical protein